MRPPPLTPPRARRRPAPRPARAPRWRALRLHLLESARVRRLATGALAASAGVHLATAGGAALGGRAAAAAAPRGGPISVRYLLPPDRVEAPPGERISWVRLRPAASGRAADAPDVTPPVRTPGTRDVAEATRPAPPDEGATTGPTAVYTEDEVDSAAVRDPASAGPIYPEALLARGVQGEVLVEFTVDSSGRADAASFVVVEATDPRFADAVREALPRMRFRPAVAAGRRVAQLVRIPMRFQLVRDAGPAT